MIGFLNKTTISASVIKNKSITRPNNYTILANQGNYIKIITPGVLINDKFK